MLLAWGPEDQGPHTFAAAEYAQSNGYGENRAFQRGSAIAQYEGKLGDRGLWRVTGQAYSVVAQAAGVIREDDYEAGRIGFYDTYDPNQGQDSSRYSIAADLETRSRNVTSRPAALLHRPLDRASARTSPGSSPTPASGGSRAARCSIWR